MCMLTELAYPVEEKTAETVKRTLWRQSRAVITARRRRLFRISSADMYGRGKVVCARPARLGLLAFLGT